jgi:serine/threonine protein phosphatase PrpC
MSLFNCYFAVKGGCSSNGGSGSSSSPLTAEPELTQHELAPNDEFVVLGCDGLWDVISSQRAVELARQKLREHNDPQRCARSPSTASLLLRVWYAVGAG